LQVKLKSIIANGEIEKPHADTGEIKQCQRRQMAGLELQNRCSATELNWLNDAVPSGAYFGRVKFDSKLIRRSLDTHSLEVAQLRRSDSLLFLSFASMKRGTSLGPTWISTRASFTSASRKTAKPGGFRSIRACAACWKHYAPPSQTRHRKSRSCAFSSARSQSTAPQSESPTTICATCSPPVASKTAWTSQPFRAGLGIRTAALFA
jgi:hypothetical protein